MEIIDCLREFQINTHSTHFHRLKIPEDLMTVCRLINTNRQIQYDYVLPPHPNIYAYVTNCMCCDECFVKKIDPHTRDSIYTNAQYINSFLVKNLYEIVSMDPKIIEYIRINRPKEYITMHTLAFMKEKDMLILVRDWPRIAATYQKLFGIPVYLDGAVSREHYEKFHSRYMTDAAGHLWLITDGCGKRWMIWRRGGISSNVYICSCSLNKIDFFSISISGISLA